MLKSVKLFILVDMLQAWLWKIMLNIGDAIGRALIYNRGLKTEFDADASYGDDPEQRMDIFRPDGESRAVLVYVHGGGWISGKRTSYRRICADFAAQGFTVYSIDYRLGPRYGFPIPVQDVARAIYRISQLEPNAKIFLAGDSAGAQLISWYAVAINRPELFELVGVERHLERVEALLLFYGVYDFVELHQIKFPGIMLMARTLLGSRYFELAEAMSPLRQISPDFPPVFISAGASDGLYPQTLAFIDRLQLVGVKHQALLFTRDENAGHSFLNFYYRACSQSARRQAVDFMQRRL